MIPSPTVLVSTADLKYPNAVDRQDWWVVVMIGDPFHPKKATISLRVDRQIKDVAKNYARQRQTPLAEVMRDLLARYVAECARENALAAPDLLKERPAQYVDFATLEGIINCRDGSGPA